MKKLLLVFALVLSGMVASQATAQQNAIGLRLGYGAEVNYQRALSDANRLELGLGLLGFNGFGVSGVYQWTWELPQLAPGFSWYAGPGLGIGFSGAFFSAAVLGQIGLQYKFNIPLNLSLDWRPGVGLYGGGFNFNATSVGLGIRYCF